MDCITSYFANLNALQIKQFKSLEGLYLNWNAQINVISRKDTDHFYQRHVLHSLAISKIVTFQSGAKILDIGTGGGFPGIPLAILFPEVEFHLVDSIGKKIKVVQEIGKALGLKNIKTSHARAETIQGKYDFIVSRAVTQMPIFINWVKGKTLLRNMHELKNGILYLKGGNLDEELSTLDFPYKEYSISNYFKEDFFETKKVVYVQLVQ